VGVITQIRKLLGFTMIDGYRFIERETARHEPQIARTRATVSWVVREIELGATVDSLYRHYEAKVPREAFEEAVRYGQENSVEIQGYIQESIKSSGMRFKTR